MLPGESRKPMPRRLVALSVLILLWCGLGAVLAVALLMAAASLAMRKLLGNPVERQ